jgi:glycosyltransferase involved in cell wall biosynthesis
VDRGLKKADKVKVIPTCVNFDVFKPFDFTVRKRQRKTWGIPESSLVFLYSGSVGTNYRTDLVLKFFVELQKQRKDVFIAFLSHSDHNIIWAEIDKAGIDRSLCRIRSASYLEVGENLMVGDVGLIMYDKGFSVIGRSPTKLGEYWASGLLCLSTKGIGDLEAIVDAYPGSGFLIKELQSDEEYANGITAILEISADKAKLREFAYDYFALEKGVDAYLNMYKSLT